MKKETILTIVFSLIFVISIIVSLFGAIKVVDQAIRFALNAHMIVCEPYYPTEGRDTPPIPVKGEPCYPDIRFMKERIAEGSAMFLIAFPLAVWGYRRLRRIKDEDNL